MAYHHPRTALGFKDSVNSLGGYSSYSTGDLAGASDDEVLDGYERVSTALLASVPTGMLQLPGSCRLLTSYDHT